MSTITPTNYNKINTSLNSPDVDETRHLNNINNISPEQLTQISNYLKKEHEKIITISKAPLPKPIVNLLETAALSLESLLESLNFAERKQAVRDGLNSIEARGKEKAQANKEKMKQIQKNIKKIEKQENISGFQKAFKVLGMFIGAISSIATIAAGCMTANPMLAAGGLVLLYMTANSMLSEATDGKISIGAGIAWIAEKLGASEEKAKIIGAVGEMLITLVGVIMTLGASSGNAASLGATAFEKTKNIATIASKTASLANAATSLGSGALKIASSYNDFKMAKIQAEMKELEAILLKIQIADDRDLDSVKSILENIEALFESVSNIVKNNNQTITAIATTSPTVA